MKVFHCESCKALVHFPNVSCLSCGHPLAFLPAFGVISAMEQREDGAWLALAPAAKNIAYQLCQNYAEHQNCNWVVAADDDNPLCVSCRQTQVIPNLESPGNREAWWRMEAAKRQLIYTLLMLRLPLASRSEDPEHGVAYAFLSDEGDSTEGPVLTGHDSGLITINIAEANDAERERRRVALHEPYRTLLGHFRHEVGHYYWDRLVLNSPRLEAFRELFGDERIDYAEALKNHYDNPGSVDWQQSFISFYASSHPWEDWAESWAHYLHMIDALETAADCGLSMRAKTRGDPAFQLARQAADPRAASFDSMIDNWLALAYALNNLNRSLGQPDGYPFVLSEPVIAKLRFVHETILAT